MLIMVGLAVFLAVTLLSGALWMWKRKSSSAKGHSSTGESGQSVPKPGDDTYAALNPMNMSPDYDTLQGVAPRLSEKYSRPGE
ncbi:hypothetical protein AMELA_G00000700 [Ameiurus melas]|uniref:Uncharacterized protein n=1 Tax=Ameiurus melas TaxID=219545 RepID=A0A7J6BET7_AMEME|nr:hypothetical protein AMELA_G00000700 [Ameiurus melas]